jgi:hypothetical protein
MSFEKTALRHNVLTGLLLGLVVAGLSCFAVTQSEPGPPPPDSFHVMTAGPMGGMAIGGMMHDGMGEGKTVKGAPLSAEIMMIRDTTLADGNRIHTESQTRIYRDSAGRVRREVGFELNTPTTGAAKRSMIVITDPVSGNRYMLNPETKTAHQMPLHPPHPDAGSSGREHDKMWSKSDANVTKEALGTKSINGLQAEGTRVTRTIPAGEIGNTKAIQVVTERWYSNDLQMPVTMTHTDPMMGTVTTNLTNVNRAEPDASLFQVPSDYKVEVGKAGDMMYMPMKP